MTRVSFIDGGERYSTTKKNLVGLKISTFPQVFMEWVLTNDGGRDVSAVDWEGDIVCSCNGWERWPCDSCGEGKLGWGVVFRGELGEGCREVGIGINDVSWRVVGSMGMVEGDGWLWATQEKAKMVSTNWTCVAS